MFNLREEIATVFNSIIEDEQSIDDFLREKDIEGRLDKKSMIGIISVLCRAVEEAKLEPEIIIKEIKAKPHEKTAKTSRKGSTK